MEAAEEQGYGSGAEYTERAEPSCVQGEWLRVLVGVNEELRSAGCGWVEFPWGCHCWSKNTERERGTHEAKSTEQASNR